MGMPIWRRCVVVVMATVLVLEAGALGPALPVSAAPAPYLPISDAPEAQTEEQPADPDTAEPDELVDLRTETSRTFDNHDGTVTTQLFTEPIHYQPADSGTWQPVEVGFRATSEDGQRLVSDRAPTTIGLRTADDPDGFLEVTHADYRIAFRLLGAGTADALDTTRVADVAPAVDDPRL